MAILRPKEERIKKLDTLLKEYTSKRGFTNENQQQLDVKSTFIDVANYFDEFKNFENEYKYRKANAPNFKIALESWINEIENISLKKSFNNDFLILAYQRTLQGKFSILETFEANFSEVDPDRSDYFEKYYMFTVNLERIAKGVVSAFKLHELKSELIDLSEETEKINPIESSQNRKIKWLGTPGEFGAIFNKLFDNGYIEVVKDKANMARFLNSIFDIQNDEGNPINEKYLYKCFGEKEKKYNPNQLKIPFSDNYNKGK